MGTSSNEQETNTSAGVLVAIVIAWCWAGIPLAWGVIQTLHKAAALFNMQ